MSAALCSPPLWPWLGLGFHGWPGLMTHGTGPAVPLLGESWPSLPTAQARREQDSGCSFPSIYTDELGQGEQCSCRVQPAPGTALCPHPCRSRDSKLPAGACGLELEAGCTGLQKPSSRGLQLLLASALEAGDPDSPFPPQHLCFKATSGV